MREWQRRLSWKSTSAYASAIFSNCVLWILCVMGTDTGFPSWSRKHGIKPTDLLFPISERAIQKQLKIVCDYLGYEGISTHSFRKWYATEIYKANGYDISLVQRLLQHSSSAITQRYIGIEPERIERAIEGHAQLIW